MVARSPSGAVLFHYFEAGQTYRDNLVYFLAQGWRPDVDFYIICSGPCSVTLPLWDNLHVIHAPNLNLDYGGYCHAVAQHGDKLAQYQTLVFINCSVRGPFVPRYLTKSWYDIFADQLKGDVHLVGSTYNSLPDARGYLRNPPEDGAPHLQTTAYAMTDTAFAALRQAGFYDQFEEQSKKQIIVAYEIGLTTFAHAKGWQVKSILPDLALEDPFQAARFPNFAGSSGDVLRCGEYFGRTVYPDEVIFIKTNRNLMTEKSLAALTYTRLDAIPSWEVAADLQRQSYLTAKTLHKSEEKRQKDNSFRTRLVRKLLQWVDADQ